LPNKAKKFEERAAQIAKHRVIVGMHYLHDLEGGKQLADLIVEQLLQKQDFQNDFKAAKLELLRKNN
jgi:acid phosphatase (class A)